MLVLTRKRNERIIIGDDIVITFLGKIGSYNSARLGIDAPHETHIVREALLDKEKTQSVYEKSGSTDITGFSNARKNGNEE